MAGAKQRQMLGEGSRARYPAATEAMRVRRHENVLAGVAAVFQVIFRIAAQHHDASGGLRDELAEIGGRGNRAEHGRGRHYHKFPRLDVDGGGGQAAAVDEVYEYLPRNGLARIGANRSPRFQSGNAIHNRFSISPLRPARLYAALL